MRCFRSCPCFQICSCFVPFQNSEFGKDHGTELERARLVVFFFPSLDERFPRKQRTESFTLPHNLDTASIKRARPKSDHLTIA
jgi:hypothetical protein